MTGGSRIPELPRRRVGPRLTMAIDLVLHAFRRRSWLLLVVGACAALAALLAVVGQATVPYLIYPAL